MVREFLVSEIQSENTKPRFELVLGAVLLIVVAILTLVSNRSDQSKASSYPTENQVDWLVSVDNSDQAVQSQGVEFEREIYNDTTFGPANTWADQSLNVASTASPVSEKSPARKIVRFFELGDLLDVDMSEYMDNLNPSTLRVWTRSEHPEVVQVFKFNSSSRPEAFLGAATDGQSQPGQLKAINGEIWVLENGTANLIITLEVIPAQSSE